MPKLFVTPASSTPLASSTTGRKTTSRDGLATRANIFRRRPHTEEKLPAEGAIGKCFFLHITRIPVAALADFHHVNRKFSIAADNLPPLPATAPCITLRLVQLFGKSGLKLWTYWLPPPGSKVAPVGYLSRPLIGEYFLLVASPLVFKSVKKDKVFTEIFSQDGVCHQWFPFLCFLGFSRHSVHKIIIKNSAKSLVIYLNHRYGQA